MLFHSFAYLLLFLPVVIVVHGVLRKHTAWPWPQVWLLVASVFFYTRAPSANLPLLAGSILFNWAVARIMMAQHDLRKRKWVLLVGLTSNIIVLFLFKYVQLFARRGICLTDG